MDVSYYSTESSVSGWSSNSYWQIPGRSYQSLGNLQATPYPSPSMVSEDSYYLLGFPRFFSSLQTQKRAIPLSPLLFLNKPTIPSFFNFLSLWGFLCSDRFFRCTSRRQLWLMQMRTLSSGEAACPGRPHGAQDLGDWPNPLVLHLQAELLREGRL